MLKLLFPQLKSLKNSKREIEDSGQIRIDRDHKISCLLFTAKGVGTTTMY